MSTPVPAPVPLAAILSSVRPLGLTLRRLLQSIRSHADRRLVAHDLTHAQWAPLYVLFKGECATVATLARDMDMDPAAVTRSLDRLESKGLIQRVRSCTDRRVVNLALTEQGRRVAEVVPAVLTEVMALHLAGFSQDEVHLVHDLLDRMLNNGEALRSAAPEGAQEGAPAPESA